MNSVIIFGLLIALMLTGMPISIALGLTVLTYLFLLTSVPIEAVALKLFTGIESFEIMAIPFFILAGNFLTHGGVARRMIRFATALVGHWYNRRVQTSRDPGRAERLGVLVASGMIVGESLFGVLNAGLIVATSNDAPIALAPADFAAAPILGPLLFIGLVVWLYRWMLRKS